MAKDLSRTINIAVPAVLIVATIALLLVFMPEEPGALFWFNFCFIIRIIFEHIFGQCSRVATVLLEEIGIKEMSASQILEKLSRGI